MSIDEACLRTAVRGLRITAEQGNRLLQQRFILAGPITRGRNGGC